MSLLHVEPFAYLVALQRHEAAVAPRSQRLDAVELHRGSDGPDEQGRRPTAGLIRPLRPALPDAPTPDCLRLDVTR